MAFPGSRPVSGANRAIPVHHGGEGLSILFSEIPDTPNPAVAVAWYLQCPPLEDFKIQRAFSFNDYDTIRKGQFTRRGGRQLDTIQFNALILDDAPFILHPMRIEDQIDLLDDLLETGLPFQFTAAHEPGFFGQPPEVNMPAVLRSLSKDEKAGEGDARYVELAITEWRSPMTNAKSSQAPPVKNLPAYCTVHANGHATTSTGQRIKQKSGVGVTLYDLAKWFYHDADLWREIFKANSLKNVGPSTSLVKILTGPASKRHDRKLTIPIALKARTTEAAADEAALDKKQLQRGRHPKKGSKN